MPVHIHTAILDVAVIIGGLVMISAAARQLVAYSPNQTLPARSRLRLLASDKGQGPFRKLPQCSGKRPGRNSGPHFRNCVPPVVYMGELLHL